MSSDDGELGNSGCISPIIRAAAFSSLTPFPLSLFTLPPSLCALVKISSVPRPIFSPLLLLLLLLYSALSPHHLHAPLLPLTLPPLLLLPLHCPGYGLNMTAIPLKRGGIIIIIIRAHQQQAAPWTNLTNTERETQRRPPPIHPPQPWGSDVSI